MKKRFKQPYTVELNSNLSLRPHACWSLYAQLQDDWERPWSPQWFCLVGPDRPRLRLPLQSGYWAPQSREQLGQHHCTQIWLQRLLVCSLIPSFWKIYTPWFKTYHFQYRVFKKVNKYLYKGSIFLILPAPPPPPSSWVNFFFFCVTFR